MEVDFIQKAIQNTLDHPGNTLCETSRDLLGTCLVTLKQKTEIRAYVVNTLDERVDNVEVIGLTDEEFMFEAEEQGKVFTLHGFQNAFNQITTGVGQEVDVVRFIEVPVHE